MKGRILIVGVSTRAMAESAVRAGYDCITVDRFGDLDQKSIVTNVGLTCELGIPWSPARAERVARRIEAGGVVYGANLENHPVWVERLSRGRELLGSDAVTLRRVRDPIALAAALRRVGLRTPTVLEGDAVRAADPARRWLRKPRAGGGGRRIAEWQPGDRLQRGNVVQRLVRGVPASAAFAADGRRGVLLGVTRQLVGDPSFGASGFRYCGSVLPLTDRPTPFAAAVRDARQAGEALVRLYGLRGVFGIDFVLNRRGLHVIEVNPRYTASMELIERLQGLSIFDVHVQACRGSLPAFDPCRALIAGTALGKAIVFARTQLTLGDTRSWLGRDISDVPRPGTTVPEGAPICTVFATGSTPSACLRALKDRAAALERGEASRRPRPRLAL